jgi:hypothetical protein
MYSIISKPIQEDSIRVCFNVEDEIYSRWNEFVENYSYPSRILEQALNYYMDNYKEYTVENLEEGSFHRHKLTIDKNVYLSWKAFTSLNESRKSSISMAIKQFMDYVEDEQVKITIYE